MTVSIDEVFKAKRKLWEKARGIGKWKIPLKAKRAIEKSIKRSKIISKLNYE